MKKLLMNEKGANEIVTSGLVILFGLVVAIGAYVAMNPSIQAGVAAVTGRITTAFTTIGGL